MRGNKIFDIFLKLFKKDIKNIKSPDSRFCVIDRSGHVNGSQLEKMKKYIPYMSLP